MAEAIESSYRHQEAFKICLMLPPIFQPKLSLGSRDVLGLLFDMVIPLAVGMQSKYSEIRNCFLIKTDGKKSS